MKETVIEAIKSMLITQVIEAGIKWLLSLLIPAITKAILALAAGSIAGVGKAIEFGLASLLLRGGEVVATCYRIVRKTHRTRWIE